MTVRTIRGRMKMLWKKCCVDSVKVEIFNPENDLALADGTSAYSAPPAAMRIAGDLSTLPLWYGGCGNKVYLPHSLHGGYYDSFSKLFLLAEPYGKERLDDVDAVSPWGWSMQLHRRLRHLGMDGNKMPSEHEINAIRNISNRKTSIRILESLRCRQIDTPPMPVYYSAPEDVALFVNSHERCVIKAPWSGSGKGIMWGKGRVERPLEQFYKGIIRRQGGVVCEAYLEGVVEFAMEFCAAEGDVTFAGYSLFTTSNASYDGNILAADDDIGAFLSQYVSLDQLHRVKEDLCGILKELLAGSGYSGYLGVDMMLYDDNGCIRLNPCMELNLRMNMGMVSRLFYDRHVSQGVAGRYNVTYFKTPGEAVSLHGRLKREFPLSVVGGRVQSGYINLSPVTQETSYMAYAVIVPGATVAELYDLKAFCIFADNKNLK